MASAIEEPGHAGQAKCVTDGAHDEQALAAEVIDHRHANQGEEPIGGADHDTLHIARYAGETRGGKNAVQIIKMAVMPASWLNAPMVMARKSG